MNNSITLFFPFNKFFQKICTILCNFSLLLNIFLPYLAITPAHAQEATPVPTEIPIPTSEPIVVPTVEPTSTEPVEVPTAIPTEEPVVTPVVTEEPIVSPEPTASAETITPEVTITPIVTGVNEVNTPAENDDNNNQPSGDNSNSASPSTTPDSSPIVPTPSFMVPSPTPTPSTRVVEQVCPVAGDTMRDSVELDWNYDCATDTYTTREKVQLGVKYIFPNENNVTVTFTSLPKDDLYRSYLKIKQVKTSDLKLPENVGNVGEYAYDITTDMFDGEFKYDITLPKNPDQTAEISYIEKTLEQAKTGVTPNEINSVDESKTEQQNNKVAATNIDHFTIYIVRTYDDVTLNVPKSSYNQGETVYIEGKSLALLHLRIVIRDNNHIIVKTCSEQLGFITTCSYPLPADASVGTWSVDLERNFFGWEEKDSANFEVVSQNCSTVCPIKTFSTSHTLYENDFVEYSAWGSDHNNSCSSGDGEPDTCQDWSVGGGSRKHHHRSVINQHACPNGYIYREQSGSDDCYKDEPFGPVSVTYIKSNDQNKCHRPTASSLSVPSWATNDFNSQLNEWENYSLEAPEGYYLSAGVCYPKTGVCVDPNALNYHSSLSSTEIADNTKCTYTPEEACPVTCDYPGSTTSIPDGHGGYKTCPSTATCYTPICGNGIIDTSINDKCDDSNLVNGDGCSDTCKIEKGWDCVGEPSLCADNGKKITICHASGLSGTTKFETLNLSENAVYSPGNGGHFNEDGTPKAGHESDYLGACTAEDLCGNDILDAGEQCDGTAGTTAGYFCTKTCRSIKIYDGPTSCPSGTVKSATPITKTISSTDSDGESFTLTSGGKYLFEANGTFAPTSVAGYLSDAGYTLINGLLSSQYGISATGNDFAAHALIADLGAGVGMFNWGNYNSSHTYSKYFEPSSSNVQFLISDRYSNWNPEYQNQSGMNDNSGSLTLNVYECQNPPVKIYAQKVVCDDENYLPNNTQGAITANTAQNWVNNSNGHCRLADNWNFQYGGIGTFGEFQTNTQSLSNWQTITTTAGTATATINDLTPYGSKIEVREVFPDNTYVPFSNSSNNVSAEIYCTGDGANYDNWEWINNPQYGQSYYCVAFNALNSGTITVDKVTNPTGDSQSFDYIIKKDTINVDSFSLTDSANPYNHNFITGHYTIIESANSAWAQGDISCSGRGDVTNLETHVGNPSYYNGLGNVSFDLGPGAAVTCSFNNIKHGTVNVTKYNDINSNGQRDCLENNDNGGDLLLSRVACQLEPLLPDWDMSLSGYNTIQTDDNGQATFANIPQGTYLVGETMQPGWTQTDITCTGGSTPSTCGNGIVEGSEQCDDYNHENGDGCSSTCQNEQRENCYDDIDNDGDGYIDYDDSDCEASFRLVKTVNAQIRDIPEGMEQITVNPGDTINCSVGNRLITPTATISKWNNADLSGQAPGSSVEFKIKVLISGNDVNDFNIIDLLSNGFKYRSGSYNVFKNGSNITVGITEPIYHSPGIWNLGNLNIGDTIELSYIADISTDQQPGTYTDLALAKGIAKYEPAKTVVASADSLGYVADTFVGTEVPVVKSTQNTVSAGVERREEGQVLGVSTELPATGSSTLWLIISFLMSLLGLIFVKKSSKKILIIILFSIFYIFPNQVKAVSNLSVRVEQPKTPINTNSVDLNFVALDLNANPITIACFKKYSTDAAFTQFGSDIVLSAGGNASHCPLSSVLTTEGTYQFYVTATSTETVTSSIISLDYKTSGPGTPGDYSKNKINSCDYKIHFKTADDGGKTVKVEIYRADVTSFILDAGSVVSTVSVGSNEQRDITNSVPDCNKNYYYVLRAFDSAGNGSGTIGDSVTITTTSSTSNSTTVKTPTTGAIPVTNTNLTPGEANTLSGTPTPETPSTSENGSVLGTQTAPKTFLQQYWLPLLLTILVIVSIITYVFVKRKRSY